MSVAYAVRSHCRKLIKLSSIFRRDFNSSKCKTWARMTTARIKLLRNKRETVVRQMRRDVALLLQSGQDATARIRVEHVIREQNMMAANEILELFCERIVTRLSIVAKQRACPTDLKEAISSLIFAGPRCSDIPELLAIRDIFQKKYGKEFVSAATDLRPDSGVNRLLIEKLSALNPSGEVKLKVMKEIAKEYQVEWDTAETESELLKPPEERIEGHRTFVSAGSLLLNPGAALLTSEAQKLSNRVSSGGGNEMGSKKYEDAASAAKAAADSAKSAIAAAQAAAQMVQTSSYNCSHNTMNNSYDMNDDDNSGLHQRYRSQSLGAGNNHSTGKAYVGPDDMDNTGFNIRRHSYNNVHGGGAGNNHTTGKAYVGPNDMDDTDSNIRRHSYNVCDAGKGNVCSTGKAYVGPDDMDDTGRNIRGRHSYNVRDAHTDIKFDESDYEDEDTEMDQQQSNGMRKPTSKVNPGNISSVHPKFPDYDAITARFEALKYRKT